MDVPELREAVADLVKKAAISKNRLLDVQTEAEKLAFKFSDCGLSPDDIADKIIERGIGANLSMRLNHPSNSA